MNWYRHYYWLATKMAAIAQGKHPDSIEQRCYRHIRSRRMYHHARMTQTAVRRRLRAHLGAQHGMPDRQYLEAMAETLAAR